ncbi:anthranilate synthase component I family protein [Pelovirga terrestris]|uniref:Anthranilate synthase component 1 n=1 Tax=Pelovirga terrestris TaxID=2771352 RepID=A0A8J6UQN6_9BACT|nr:anthranilate synthase component I family protein [Pelovirga terrestris]MBD1399361.1 anthranilate synthase component I family protein [Pelovirga terrestris]
MKTTSFTLTTFDPLALYLSCVPDGPGLLESLNPLTKTGRYSIVPLRRQELYTLANHQLHWQHPDGSQSSSDQPMKTLAQILAERRCPRSAETPFPGGFFGFFGYDLARQIEDLPYQATRDLPLADLYLNWVDVTAVYDHHQQLMTLATLDNSVDLQHWREQVLLSQISPPPETPLSLRQEPQGVMTQQDFIAIVKRARDYIAAGDIYQVNLSCRFDAVVDGSAGELYRRLRQINPAPFACLLKFGEVEIISSSPERLVSLRDGIAQTRPIAGTRPRGFTPPEDHQLGKELLGHPKERAEHIMLLDLERNDLGKVCQGGTVVVDELMVLERYSHVTHIVSNVRATLRPDCTAIDLLKATFPGGTITGVPKKRCMEIIDELEPMGRGSYTGSAGYISACGSADLNILIRGFQRIGNHLSYQTGAGIVADSVPEREWQECLDKGKALSALLHSLER